MAMNSWSEFDQYASLTPASLLNEVARHMENGYDNREQPDSTRFRAAHQLAHKGWRFPSGMYDTQSGQMTSGIKAIRALIICNKSNWFRSAARRVDQDMRPTRRTSIEDAGTAQFVSSIARGSSIYHLEAEDHVIFLTQTNSGWRIAGMICKDALGSGIKDALVMSAAMSRGCVIPAVSFTAIVAVCMQLLTG